MKIGDRVEVVELEKDDFKWTNISMRATGVITDYEITPYTDIHDLVYICFDNTITYSYTGNLSDKGYCMHKYQLRLIE